jgi:hypothetical protein
MDYGKSVMIAGAMIILASSVAFDWAAFSRETIADQVAPIALVAGLVGLIIWLTGCVMICRKLSAPALFGGGVAMLIFLFFGGTLLEHISPALVNVHIGLPGIMAPMAGCFIGGIMFILVGMFRLAVN